MAAVLAAATQAEVPDRHPVFNERGVPAYRPRGEPTFVAISCHLDDIKVCVVEA